MSSASVLNTTSGLNGKTLVIAEGPATITGLLSFSRSTSPPFAVNSGAAKVDNLHADKLDGEEGTAFHDASLLTGTIAALSGVNLTALNAAALGSGVVPAARQRTVVTSTAVGAQNDWAPGLVGDTTIFWNGASDIAVTGIAGGIAGQRVVIRNVTSAKIATFAHASGSSSAGNKFKNVATSGLTPIAPGGSAEYHYDGTDWRLVHHEQGAWITPTFAAGDFTGNGSMTWTVASGDVTTMAYRLSGCTLQVLFNLVTTTVAGTPSTQLLIGNGQWGGFTIAKSAILPTLANDNAGGIVAAIANTAASGTTIPLYKSTAGAGNWAAATDTTGVAGQLAFEVV